MSTKTKVLIGVLSLVIVSALAFSLDASSLMGNLRLITRQPVLAPAPLQSGPPSLQARSDFLQASPDFFRVIPNFLTKFVQPIEDVHTLPSQPVDDVFDMERTKEMFDDYQSILAGDLKFTDSQYPELVRMFDQESKLSRDIDKETLKEKIQDEFKRKYKIFGDDFFDDVETDVTDDIENLLSDKDWLYTEDGMPDDNYIFAYPLTDPGQILNIDEIDENEPTKNPVAGAFGLCVIGNQEATIHSPVLAGRGEPYFKVDIKASMSDFNDVSGQYEFFPLWTSASGENKPVKEFNHFESQFTSPKTVTLNPDMENECSSVLLQYTNVTPLENDDVIMDPAYQGIALAGISANLPVYYLVDNSFVEKLGSENSPGLPGSLNVFNSTKSVAFRVNFPIEEQDEPINAGDAHLGTFSFASYPHSTSTITALDVELIAADYDELDFEGDLHVGQYAKGQYYSNSVWKGTDQEITLQKGANHIEFDEPIVLPYAETAFGDFNVDKLPSTPGDLQLKITKVYSDGEVYQMTQSGCYSYPYQNCSKDFDSYSMMITHVFVPGEETDPVIRLNYGPKNKDLSEKLWFSNNDILNSENFYEPRLFWIDLDSFPYVDAGATIKTDPIEVDVLGTFTSPMKLNLVSAGSFGEISVDEVTVVPGDTITFPSTDIEPGRWVEFYISAADMADDAGLFAKNIRFKADDVTANYLNDGIVVTAGDVTPLFFIEQDQFALFPLVSKFFFFGFEYLSASSNGGSSAIPQEIFLDDPEFDADTYALSKTNIQAQGNLQLFGNSDLDNPFGFTYTFKYKHMYAPSSPFEDIILEVGGDKLYYNDAIAEGGAKWSPSELEFTLTNSEHLGHSQDQSLDLFVEAPEDQVIGAWFTLDSISVTSDDGEIIPIYTSLVPSPKELFESPIGGQVYNFWCDDFNANDVCDYIE